MKLKIALIGAGSEEFGPGTIRDIALSDILNEHDLEVSLMDLDEGSLQKTRAYAENLTKTLKRDIKYSYTVDLNEALRDANFVVAAIEIRRYFYWSQDFHVPRKYGFSQVYGENGGPGGMFHALRNMGPSVGIAKAMEKVCPDATFLNYTNPLAKLSEAITRLSSIKTIGLCHGVFHGMGQVSRLLQMPQEDIHFRASGINHFTWFQTIQDKKTGADLYPKLKDKEKQAHWLGEWDEIALSRVLMRNFGLFPSPGTNHIGEYVGWADEFLGSAKLQYFYDPGEDNPWESGKIPTYLYNIHTAASRMPLFPEKEVTFIYPDGHAEKDEEIKPSGELAIPIIEGIFCGQERQLDAVNIPNKGHVPGLPEDAVIEVPAVANKDGLHAEKMKPLPDSVVGLLSTQCSINKLIVEAFDEKSKSKLVQAVLLDPTCNSYQNAIHMVDELIGLQKKVLPELR